MTYSIKDHGDLLEKEASSFIAQKFNNYELVWQIYIGNTGNACMAKLPNYPSEEKRISFAEHSYTVLESAFINYKILESQIFEKSIGSFKDYLDYNNAFISFFAHLGRMHDTIIKASDILLKDKRFITSIHQFYEARCIVIHGKKIPIILDELGLPQIPVIKTTLINGNSWNDKTNIWADAKHMNTLYVQDNVTKYFNDLMVLIDNEYAVFKDTICQELKSIRTKLIFEYSPTIFLNPSEFITMPSGSGYGSNFDVLGAMKYLGVSGKNKD
jgi:hypothetical protein